MYCNSKTIHLLRNIIIFSSVTILNMYKLNNYLKLKVMTNKSVLKGILRKILSIKNISQFSRKLLAIMKNVQKIYCWLFNWICYLYYFL